METDIELEETKIRVFICREDATPILIHQLSAKGQEEFRSMLRHLELFAEFLPYIQKAEKEMNDSLTQNEFQLRITLANLKTAIELVASKSKGEAKIIPILREHEG